MAKKRKKAAKKTKKKAKKKAKKRRRQLNLQFFLKNASPNESLERRFFYSEISSEAT